MAATAISRMSSFPSIIRKVQLQRRFPPRSIIAYRPKLSVSMSLEHGNNATSSDIKTTLDYSIGAQKSSFEKGPAAEKLEMTSAVKENSSSQPKKAAKIHDFCFGIPFGGLVLSGGLFGFIFSRNPAFLGTGVLFGVALLVLSTCSLKIWRQGKSSTPFILGQAALAAGLLWKNFQTYSLTRNLFPTVFYILTSAAMMCFYSYVLLSGGNPPPKKLKSSATVLS